MSPDPITRLNAALEGRYRIESELGEGGMATVYLADDLKHERKVALKVLKPELAAVVGAERFLAEIKTTANLQHPHILGLYDSGEADGMLFYVMPYVEGESLRERLDREHQLPVDDAVRIATNVAEALDYAHRQGVIHRDIKPANILLQDGKPVISDFGIALAVSAGGGGRLTETGLSLGTPHYMSPEQATGDLHVGPATDIYALGCVLYETLVGEPPFTGSTPQAVLGRIISGNADRVTEHRSSVPPNVAAAVSRALEKVPADRFGGARELAAALGDRGFRHGRGKEQAGKDAARLAWGATVALIALAAWGWLRPTPAARSHHLSVYVPTGVMMRNGQQPTLALSPNGRLLAYETSGELHLRSLDRFDAMSVPTGAVSPFFSPDGEWVVAFDSRTRQNVRVRIDDQSVLPGGGTQWGASWGEDGSIVFAEGGAGQSGLWRVAADGGEPGRITTVDDSQMETAHVWPEVLPGGQGVVFTVLGPSGGWTDSRLAVLAEDASGHRYLPLGQGATFGRFVPPDHLVYTVADGTVMAVRFDPGRLEVSGSGAPVLSGVRVASFGGAASWSVSREGTAAFVVGTSAEDHVLLWVDRRGQVQHQIGSPTQGARPVLSPDDERIAMTVRAPNNNRIVVVEVESGRSEPWTFAASEDETPIWSPVGDGLAYSAAHTGQARHIFRVRTPGADAQDSVFTASGHMHLNSWSPDGQYLIGDQRGPETASDVWLIQADGGGATPIMSEQFNELFPSFSPDGNWVVYQSDRSGTTELYVRSFPDLGPTRQLTEGGGELPKWASAANELIYRVPGTNTLMAVSYSLDNGFQFEAPTAVFEFPRPFSQFDVSADAERFVVLTSNPDAAANEIRIVTDFPGILKRLVPN